MIYLTYLASEEGTPIWFYVHPKIPDYILEKIAGKDHGLIVNFLSAVSMFGYDTLGGKLQIVEFEHVKMSYKYIDVNGKKLLAVALTDPMDNPKLVWKVFDEFIKKNQHHLEKIIPSEDLLLDKEVVDKTSMILNREFTKILENRVRLFKVLGKRDLRNLLVSLVLGIIFYAITIGITYWLYKSYNLQNNPTLFFYILTFLNFIIPGVFIGWVTGYWRGALINGIIIALISILVLTAVWWAQLTAAVEALYRIGPETIMLGVLIVAGIIGGAMGLIAAFVAWFFVETRTLVPSE